MKERINLAFSLKFSGVGTLIDIFATFRGLYFFARIKKSEKVVYAFKDVSEIFTVTLMAASGWEFLKTDFKILIVLFRVNEEWFKP